MGGGGGGQVVLLQFVDLAEPKKVIWTLQYGASVFHYTLPSEAPIWDFADYPITDIEILVIADTDNWSDIYVYHTFACIWQNYHFKNTVLVFFYEENIIRSEN